MYQVLLIDPSVVVRQACQVLPVWGEASGFEWAAAAADAREALQLLKQTPFDLVLSEYRLPDRSGVELLQAVRSEGLFTRLVFFSAQAEYEQVRTAFLAGAYDFLQKPLADKPLLEVLQRARNELCHARLLPFSGTNEASESGTLSGWLREAAQQLLERAVRGGSCMTELLEELCKRIGTLVADSPQRMALALQELQLDTLELAQRQHGWLRHFMDFRQPSSPTGLADAGGWKLLLDSYSQQLDRLAELFRNLLPEDPSANSLLGRIRLCALEHADQVLSVPFLSERLFINKTYISEVYKQKTGVPLVEYLTAVKMERARKLLEDGGLKIYEISDSLGFRDVEYFSRLFKARFQATPSKFRLHTAIYV